MSEFVGALVLPVEDLKERRNILESELKKTVIELLFTGLKKNMTDLFISYNMKETPSKVTWEFNGEYDDEGGTTYYPNSITVYDENGDTIELEEYITEKKSKYSDNVYEYTLDEELHEIICEERHDLYEYDIEEILL